MGLILLSFIMSNVYLETLATGIDFNGVDIKYNARGRLLYNISEVTAPADGKPSTSTLSAVQIKPLSEIAGFKRFTDRHITAVIDNLTITIGRIEGVNLDVALAIVPAELDPAHRNFEYVATSLGSKILNWRANNAYSTQNDFVLEWPSPTNITRNLVAPAPGTFLPALAFAVSNEGVAKDNRVDGGQVAVYLSAGIHCRGLTTY